MKTTHMQIILFLINVYAHYKIKDVNVNLNPEVIVITAAGENSTFVKDFTLTYSISSGDALTANGSLGSITIDKTFNKATVIKG